MISPETTNRPWQRVVADLFEFEGKTCLVTLDYYIDFFQLDHLRSSSSLCVIWKLKAYFPRQCIPEQLVKDNGSQFTSHDFLKFSRDWYFEHLTSSPHHSLGNSKARSTVKEAKKNLRISRSLLPMTANLLSTQAVSDELWLSSSSTRSDKSNITTEVLSI